MDFDIETGVMVSLLAKGFVEAQRRIENGIDERRWVLSQDSDMPHELRRGMAKLSLICLASGHHDIGSQPNTVSVLAGKPIGEWGPSLLKECPQKDLVLIDQDCGLPTSECLEVAGSEDESIENRLFERLMAMAKKAGTTGQQSVYAECRHWVTKNPCTEISVLKEFATEEIERAGIFDFFRGLPHGALYPGRILKLCAGCGSPLFPNKDLYSYPHGRCDLRECRLAYPTAGVGRVIEGIDPDKWMLARRQVLAYWVAPGLPEIEVYDALVAAGVKDVEMYPLLDAADIGVGGTKIGIDVKSYASAFHLGKKFDSGCGRLTIFQKKIVAVPDYRTRQDKNYLKTLRKTAGNKFGIEFMTVSQAIKECVK